MAIEADGGWRGWWQGRCYARGASVCFLVLSSARNGPLWYFSEDNCFLFGMTNPSLFCVFLLLL